MSKFMALIRRLFTKGDEGQKNSTHDNENRPPNDVQTVVRAPRPYDEVTLDNDGAGPKVDDPSNVQVAPKRAPRSYEEVELPAPESGQKVAVKG